jgi:enterochelin esterase-like enzyme
LLETGVVAASMPPFSRHFRDVLRAKGYALEYSEFNGNHTYACWRGSLSDGLIALVGEHASRVA